MIKVPVNELINLKILPYDLYAEGGDLLFSAGEIITPGKLLQLKYATNLFRKEEDVEDASNAPKLITPLKVKRERPLKTHSENEISCIPVETQKNIKKLYREASEIADDSSASMYFEARDKIIEEIIPSVDSVSFRSQLKVVGDHEQAHGLNVAIMSSFLASKLKMSEFEIRDIALGAMLHDIGKTKIPKKVWKKNNLSSKEQKLLELHPRLGYQIIIEEMHIEEKVARIALQHHEKNDGTGYPYHLAGSQIEVASHVVAICDIYDNLTSNLGLLKLNNSKEALKMILEMGSSWFNPEVLYTFVHMANYNDQTVIQGY